MRIAVVQHNLRPAPAQDLEALVLAASRAVAAGAQVVFLPEVLALSDGPLRDELWRRVDDEVPVPLLAPHIGPEGDAGQFVLEHEPLGRIVFVTDDACMDPDVLRDVAAQAPDMLVLAPRSESELQAEAVLELAIDLSTSVAALVLVVEPDGAEPGDAGHGGSAIVHLGEIVAEAMSGDDTVLWEIGTPIGRPEPRTQVPEVPPLLAARVAAHRGRKLDVGYPADLG